MTTEQPEQPAQPTALPIEARYFTPGIGWKRKTFKTHVIFNRWLDTLDDDVIVQTAD